jgi:RNA polymerase sigma-70 factor (ECF subfamily)
MATAGDGVVYEELYRAHSLRVGRLCRRLLRDSFEAEEVAQEVFLKMFQQCQTQNNPDNWGAWITRVTVNACHDRRRSAWWKWWRSSKDTDQNQEHPSVDRTPEQEVLGREELACVWRGFLKLSPRQREVFALRHLEGYSAEEVATALGLSSSSVRHHLFRAVRQLRKALGNQR